MPGPLKPLIAIPTTAGTGSETTGVAIFDLVAMHAKTGIAHRALQAGARHRRSRQHALDAADGGRVRPRSMCSVTRSSRTPRCPIDQRPAPGLAEAAARLSGRQPDQRYLGARRRWRWSPQYLPRALERPDDVDARGQMMLAATYAGIGFGNAGVHLPHGMSYPVAGMVRDWRPAGYAVDHAIVPHGISVILNAPAVFRFTAQAIAAPASLRREAARRRHRRIPDHTMPARSWPIA